MLKSILFNNISTIDIYWFKVSFSSSSVSCVLLVLLYSPLSVKSTFCWAMSPQLLSARFCWSGSKLLNQVKIVVISQSFGQILWFDKNCVIWSLFMLSPTSWLDQVNNRVTWIMRRNYILISNPSTSRNSILFHQPCKCFLKLSSERLSGRDDAMLQFRLTRDRLSKRRLWTSDT